MKAKSDVAKPKSRFLEIECKKCGNTMIVFSKASTKVECACGEELVVPTGGHASIRAHVHRELD